MSNTLTTDPGADQRVASARHAASVRASTDGLIANLARRVLTDAQRQRLAELAAGRSEEVEAS